MENRQIQVLVIEDDQGDAYLTSRALERAGKSKYQVECARSLTDAIEIIHRQSCDLVLLDLGLPESVGLETLSGFQLACNKDLPIIVLTGLSDEETALRALDVGALDYLVKDEVNADTLSRSIRYSLQRHQLRRELEDVNNQLETRVADRTARLAASEAKYQDLYDNAPDMFLSIEAQSLMIVECNRTFSNALGYPLDQLIGRNLSTLHPPSHQSDIGQSLRKLATFGEVREFETVFCQRDGIPIDVSINMSAVYDSQGQVAHCRCVCRDITERKQIEQELRQKSDDLAHASRLATMGEMASGIAHELNQPLHAINNYARGAVKRLHQGWLDKEALVLLFDDIAAEAVRAGDIIQGIRRYVKRREENRESFSAGKLAEAVVKIMASEASRRNVDLQVTIPENLPSVYCDQVQLEQVLINLLLNAFDAMVDIDRNRRQVELSVEMVDQAVKFLIRDAGKGVSRETLGKLFDPYFTTKPEGLGMGLSIARTIAEAHGGSLEATPNAAQGLTMMLTLPVTADGKAS